MRLSSLVAAIEKIVGAKNLEIISSPPAPPAGLIKSSAPVHTIRLRPNTGIPVVGPAILPRSEQHHESREASKAYLRARMFASVTESAPRMSRRDRRRLAKEFTRNEYRRMMADDSNTGGAA